MGSATCVVTCHSQLRVLQRQFVSDFLGLVRGGVVDNQDFKPGCDVGQHFQQFVYIVCQSALARCARAVQC